MLTLVTRGFSCLVDSLAFLGSSTIMFLGRSLKEPMQILVRNGSWLLLVFSIFICELILPSMLEAFQGFISSYLHDYLPPPPLFPVFSQFFVA